MCDGDMKIIKIKMIIKVNKNYNETIYVILIITVPIRVIINFYNNNHNCIILLPPDRY